MFNYVNLIIPTCYLARKKECLGGDLPHPSDVIMTMIGCDSYINRKNLLIFNHNRVIITYNNYRYIYTISSIGLAQKGLYRAF